MGERGKTCVRGCRLDVLYLQTTCRDSIAELCTLSTVQHVRQVGKRAKWSRSFAGFARHPRRRMRHVYTSKVPIPVACMQQSVVSRLVNLSTTAMMYFRLRNVRVPASWIPWGGSGTGIQVAQEIEDLFMAMFGSPIGGSPSRFVSHLHVAPEAAKQLDNLRVPRPCSEMGGI